ncbi:hypothetical protein O9G_005930 [Rozella allomycis CSF55]|uniref:Uncharacterized protein n=1 Tax=Rozella allomycis (strain CSF55) TaxID=988480 RepID=A0A075B473_ROZAC|nr:hypothetical protein O9G_005930 [Rozella allomycis CSF55]|eukprot:EPZ36075.1 hypothetical protein O9G_005930 [Rozella allomycis CSF55]
MKKFTVTLIAWMSLYFTQIGTSEIEGSTTLLDSVSSRSLDFGSDVATYRSTLLFRESLDNYDIPGQIDSFAFINSEDDEDETLLLQTILRCPRHHGQWTSNESKDKETIKRKLQLYFNSHDLERFETVLNETPGYLHLDILIPLFNFCYKMRYNDFFKIFLNSDSFIYSFTNLGSLMKIVSYHAREDVLELLINKGLEEKNIDAERLFRDPFTYAVSLKQPDVIKVFFRKINVRAIKLDEKILSEAIDLVKINTESKGFNDAICEYVKNEMSYGSPCGDIEQISFHATDTNLRDLLQIASSYDQKEAIEALVKYFSGNPNKNDILREILTYSLNMEQENVLEAILSENYCVSSMVGLMKVSIYHDREDLLELMIDKGLEEKDVDAEGLLKDPFTYAVGLKRSGIIKVFFRKINLLTIIVDEKILHEAVSFAMASTRSKSFIDTVCDYFEKKMNYDRRYLKITVSDDMENICKHVPESNIHDLLQIAITHGEIKAIKTFLSRSQERASLLRETLLYYINLNQLNLLKAIFIENLPGLYQSDSFILEAALNSFTYHPETTEYVIRILKALEARNARYSFKYLEFIANDNLGVIEILLNSEGEIFDKSQILYEIVRRGAVTCLKYALEKHPSLVTKSEVEKLIKSDKKIKKTVKLMLAVHSCKGKLSKMIK